MREVPPCAWSTVITQDVNLTDTSMSERFSHLCPDCSKEHREFLGNEKSTKLKIAIRALKRICYPAGPMTPEKLEKWRQSWNEDDSEEDGEDVIARIALEEMEELTTD